MPKNRKRGLLLFGFKYPYQVTVRALAVPIVLAALAGASIYSSHGSGADTGPPLSAKEETDRALALYTLWLTIFTGVLAISTIGLWRTTKRGMQDQARDMKESLRTARAGADAAVVAANAAVASVEASKRALVVGNRARLRPSVRIAGPVIIGTDVGVSVQYEMSLFNYGNAPAERVALQNVMLVSKTARSYDDPISDMQNLYSEIREEGIGSGFTIEPGQTFEPARIFFRRISPEVARGHRIETALPGEGINIKLFLVGSVTYTFESDEDDTPRQSTFIYQIGPKYEGGGADWWLVGETVNHQAENIELNDSVFRDQWLVD